MSLSMVLTPTDLSVRVPSAGTIPVCGARRLRGGKCDGELGVL